MTEKENKNSYKPPFGQQNRPGKRPTVIPPQRRTPITYIIIAILIFTVMMMLNQYQNVEKLSWNDFIDLVNKGAIKNLVIKDNVITGVFTEEYLKTEKNKKENFEVSYNPVYAPILTDIIKEKSLN